MIKLTCKKKWGGRREGSGRCRLEENKKKQGVKIYLTQKLRDGITEFGIGKTFSEKAAELIEAGIESKKK